MSVHYEDAVSEAGEHWSGYDDELREALIVHCRLASEAVDRVTEAMRASKLPFIEAAVVTGVVTRNEAVQARAWVHANKSRGASGIIERALHRRSSSRSVSLRHAGTGSAHPSLLMGRDPDSPHGERIRALRAELLLLNETDAQAGCIAVISPCAGEGRSQLTAELAIAFSQLGRPTLLVDADLRKPSQSALFRIDSSWGLAQNLSFGQAAQLFGVDQLPHLSVLPAGPIPPQPAELLAHSRLAELISRWRRGFDFVVIDTPPASQYADTVSVANAAGSVILVSRAQTTPYREMKEIVRRLGLARARVLGAVISSF